MHPTSKSELLLRAIDEFKGIDGAQIPDALLSDVWRLDYGDTDGELPPQVVGTFTRDAFDTLYFDVGRSQGLLIDDIKQAMVQGNAATIKTGRGLFRFQRA